MALSDLAVYSEYAYTAMTETLTQQVMKFNEASAGTIVLASAAHQGDFSDVVMFGAVSNLVRRRNAYGAGAIAGVDMRNIVDTKVKVAAGTPPIDLSPGQFKWIQQDPKVAGAAMGQQLAKQTMADMLNTSIGIAVVAIGQVPNNVYDATDNVAPTSGVEAGQPANTMSFINQNNAARKLGDYADNLQAWVMHSKPWFDLMNNQLTNAERLFTYGTVGVIRDPAGRLFVMTDSPNLYSATGGTETGSTAEYYTLGLAPGAITCEQNNDYDDNWSTLNGNENIVRTYQAEWSFELGLKGFSWNKSSKSPTDAALLTAANWVQYATSDKDLLGVLLKTV
jgi:hypothetical protein